MARKPKLSSERESLLSDRLRGEGTSRAGIPKRSDETRAPLSFGQERLWFLHQIEPQSPAYNRPLGLRIKGAIDIKAMESSLNKIIMRHETLRSSVGTENGVPVLRIANDLQIQLPIRDLAQVSVDMREGDARRIAREESKLPFDLNEGPLIRATLIRLDIEDHVLLLVFHHMVFDGWSEHVLKSELSALYEAQIKGEDSPLPEMEIHYSDFAQWQRSAYSDGNLDQGISYWSDQLGKGSESLEFPLDHRRPSIQTFTGASMTCQLSKNITSELMRLSREQNATLFMTLFAAFNVLLLRYTGQHDIAVGVPTAGRTHKETESMIGLFINTLPFRMDLSGDPTVRELIQRARRMVLEGLAHQTIPFEKMVERLNPERDLSRTPLFQILFNLENVPDAKSKAGTLRFETFRFDPGIAQYDLTMELQVSDEKLDCNLVFNTDLFEPDTASRILAHFQNLLEQFVIAPDQRLSALDMMSNDERRKLLTEWNGVDQEYLGQGCIHQVFERLVEQNPDAIAVISEESQLTYRQLNAFANQIAHTLLEMGLQSEMFVGIFMERSVRTIASLLAVMKAGGVYVPLNPTYPPGRLAAMLEDTELHTIITEKGMKANLPPLDVSLLDLDANDFQIRMQSVEDLQREVSTNQLMYMLYTSGSTGRPKGILVEHGNVVNVLTSLKRDPGIIADDILLSVSPETFDIAVVEFFLPLMAGARIVLVNRETATDGFLLADALFRSKATIMQATPATWRLLLNAGWQGDGHLKIFCGGESMDRGLANALLDRCAFLWNMYGPTETSIYSIIHKVEPGEEVVPIGKPIANTQIYIVDPNLNLVPIGAAGEILIGGSGVARGYQALPELTVERFVPNPFPGGKDSRLFRTGDLGRRRADGAIEFLGRQDQQVKVRGYRIELEDIEFHLQRYPGVQAAVLAAPEIRTGERQLTAYIVMRDGEVMSPDAIRNFLRNELPTYMIPSTFMQVESLPLTPSGKIDRKALIGLDQIQLAGGKEQEAPRNALEEELCAIWVDVLNLASVGIHDNFFDLGGHSLLATQVVARIRDKFHVEVLVRQLFGSGQTIAGLAEYIESLQWLARQSRSSTHSGSDGREEGEL